MGLETHELLRDANKELRQQRDIIVNVSEKNAETYQYMDVAGKRVKAMSCREFVYRAGLYSVIILLMLAIVTLIIAKIVKTT